MPEETPQQPVLDTDAQQLGVVYAKAILGAAEKAGATDALVEEFDSLLRDVLDKSPQFESLLTSGFLSQEEKVGVLDRALGDQASPLLLNFLKVLAQRDRLDCLRAVHAAVKELYEEMRGRQAVVVRTAAPIDDALAEELAQQLWKALGCEPVLQSEVDPSLVGGLILRIGDTVYDGSVASQLRRARAQMIERSIHEIQSRRDRFSDPSGD